MIGLAVNVPLIVFCSTLLVRLMERAPIIVTLGAALLGFLAGEMQLTDPPVEARFGKPPKMLANGAGAIGAAIVLATGVWPRRRRTPDVVA